LTARAPSGHDRLQMIDSHVNLHHEAFAADRDAVVARARAAGVRTMVTICDRMSNAATVLAIAEAEPDIFASVGAHPHYAKDHLDLTGRELADAAASKIVGIGETGLDLHYQHSPLEAQISVFRAHIAAARETGLPLIVHTRNADAHTAQVLEEEAQRGPLRILLHCYTSGEDLARRALALGAVISFSGILTFKNAHDVRAIAAMVPIDRVILETDCPYLAPIPHRGRRAEPAHVADVYAYFAALRGLGLEECRARVSDTFHRLFHTVPAPAPA
jgi:TatD DNase family protein